MGTKRHHTVEKYQYLFLQVRKEESFHVIQRDYKLLKALDALQTSVEQQEGNEFLKCEPHKLKKTALKINKSLEGSLGADYFQ